jgi:hypothetical protein
VCFRTNSTDAVGEEWNFLDLPIYAESFKAAQLGDLEVCISYVTFLIQEYFNLAVAFKPCDGVDCDTFHGYLLFPIPGGFASL